MTQKEQARLQILNSFLTEHIALDQAAELMGVSPRHTRRILAAYQERGAAALAHGHRGRRPANATPDAVVADVVHLAGTKYEGANHSHFSELLAEREGIVIGRTTLRRILVNAGLNSPRRRRPPKHRVRRQRMPREGMLIQLDGSYHRLLGKDGPQFTILFAVDDATGCVVNALFCDHEDTNSYFLLMQVLLRRRGIPLALYTDRHPVFKHKSEYQPAGTPTQFGRAMDEMGVQVIFALSPQAKGRVERTAGTFQDRLITELRLAGATTVKQAGAVLKQFLPRFNRRFGVPAQCPEPSFWPLGPESRLKHILCFKHRRRVARDNTVKYYRGTPCNCFPIQSAAATPERLWWYWRDWTAGCRYSMRDTSSLPRKRPPVRELSARPKRLSQPLLSRSRAIVNSFGEHSRTAELPGRPRR